MTATIIDLEPIEVLDFDIAPPCESVDHYNDEPATWIVYWKYKFPCGCVQEIRTCVVCDSCWQHWCTTTLICMYCEKIVERLSDYVDRVETLKK